MIMLMNHVFVVLLFYTVHCLYAEGFNEECLPSLVCVSDGAGDVRQELWCGNPADCKVPCVLHMALYKPWF